MNHKNNLNLSFTSDKKLTKKETAEAVAYIALRMKNSFTSMKMPDFLKGTEIVLDFSNSETIKTK